MNSVAQTNVWVAFGNYATSRFQYCSESELFTGDTSERQSFTRTRTRETSPYRDSTNFQNQEVQNFPPSKFGSVVNETW